MGVAETFDVEINLVDSVTRSAKRAAESVTGVDKSAKGSNKELASLGKQFERIGFAAARAAQRQQDAFASSWVKIGQAAEKSRQRQEKAFERSVVSHMRAVDRMEDKLRGGSFGGGFSQGIGFDQLLSATFWGSLAAGGVMSIASAFVSGAEKAVSIVVDGVKDAFKSASEEETLRVGERNILGEAGGKAFREDVGSFDKLAPFDDSEIRGMMLRLRRAGLSQAASRQAFATAVDIGGPDSGAVGGVLDQFKGIYTKQGIGKKQLKELLGDVGQTIPDFYKALGAKMKISAAEAEKRAEKGGLDPQLLMNMITEAVNKRQGGIAGTGGNRYVQTLAGEWKKVTDLPGEYYKQLSDSPGYHKAVEALGGLLEKLSPDSPQGQRIMSMIEDMFDKVTKLIGDPESTASALADNIETAIAYAKELIETFSGIADAIMPSLETIQDMVFGLRELNAWRDKDKLMQVEREKKTMLQERTNRVVEKDVRANRDAVFAQNLKGANLDAQAAQLATGEFGPVDITAVRRAATAKTVDDENKVRKAAGSTVVMHVKNEVNVHTNGEDANEAHEKAGHEVKKHLVSAGERAAAELGG